MNNNLAFVFPGQGSQALGMLAELSKKNPLINKVFADASEILGYDLWALTQQGPAEKLNQTVYTQPALLTASVAVYRIWQAARGVEPDLFAGHSLGEYTALVCANAMAFSDAVKLVAVRGRLMQEAVPAEVGAMAAIIGLEDQQVQAICETSAQGQVLAPANFNSVGQVVIAGHREAVERAIETALEKGAKIAKKLAVSVPSHCDLMKPAADQLASHLENIAIAVPTIPVINNVDVAIKTHPDDIRDALVRQLYNPVRWVEIIQRMADEGIERIIECGPGKVLTGLNRRIDRNIKTTPLQDPDSLAALT